MPDMTPEQAGWFADTFTRLVTNVEQAVVGKTHVIRLAVTCMLSEGHLLLEDFRAPARPRWRSRSRTRCKGRAAGSSSLRTCCRAT